MRDKDFQFRTPLRESHFREPQEDQPKDRREYCCELRPEFARDWSAAFHRRFSSVSVALSLAAGAIHCTARSVMKADRTEQ